MGVQDRGDKNRRHNHRLIIYHRLSHRQTLPPVALTIAIRYYTCLALSAVIDKAIPLEALLLERIRDERLGCSHIELLNKVSKRL